MGVLSKGVNYTAVCTQELTGSPLGTQTIIETQDDLVGLVVDSE